MSLNYNAYTIIKSRIIGCEYPPGAELIEREITEDLKISRTPFRDAVILLEAEGFVQRRSSRGIQVSDITLKKIKDLCYARSCIEPFLTECAVPNIPLEELNSILNMDFRILPEEESLCDNTDITDYEEQIHHMIIKYANNDYMARTANLLLEHWQRVLTLIIRCGGARICPDISRKEHRNIAEAIAARDTACAADLMRKHIERSTNVSIENLCKPEVMERLFSISLL